MTWFLFAALISAPAGEAMTATLVDGTVTAGGAPIHAGAILVVGDTVETKADSRVEIALPSGSLLRIGESSQVTLSVEPPRPFDAESEKGHRFMEWVRSRRTREGEQPGRIRREMRSPEQEHRIRERIRERRRER
ncbi:MAG: FecR domain-containing protein [Deltaproteobacteria bacterium]|nr:MAG: FecR domain-containing protein [Deltaproteobacteria bacterium]